MTKGTKFMQVPHGTLFTTRIAQKESVILWHYSNNIILLYKKSTLYLFSLHSTWVIWVKKYLNEC